LRETTQYIKITDEEGYVIPSRPLNKMYFLILVFEFIYRLFVSAAWLFKNVSETIASDINHKTDMKMFEDFVREDIEFLGDDDERNG